MYPLGHIQLKLPWLFMQVLRHGHGSEALHSLISVGTIIRQSYFRNIQMDLSLWKEMKHNMVTEKVQTWDKSKSSYQVQYLVRVSEIGRHFSWLLLCDRACPVQPSALFLSRVLLLGFGKLLSIEKECHCHFVVMCVGFTNCQNKS